MTIAQRLALALLLLTGIQLGQPAAALPLPASGEAVHIKIEGALDLGTLALVRRAIRTAQAGTSQRMVVEIDTPGGQIDLMWQIAKALDEAAKSGVTVAAWVNDEALSAGVLVAISCDKVYTRRIASIGSAQPVQMVPTGMVAVPEKAASVFRSQVRAWAESHGRSPALAVAMVDPEAEVRRVWLDGEERYITGTEWDDLTERNAAVELIGTIARRGELLNFTGPEAVEHGFADGLAESLDEVLLKLGVAAGNVATIERQRSEELLSVLNQYGLLLMVAGLLLAFVEIKAPGFGLPGILSIVCFAVLFLGRYLVGLADIPHNVLAASGIVLLAVELFLVPGTLWVGILGGICLIGGLLAGQLGSSFAFGNPMDRALLIDTTFNMIVATFGALIGGLLLSRYLPQTPMLGRLVLAGPSHDQSFAGALPEATDAHARVARTGESGVALTDLRPVGKVRLDSDANLDFEARSAGVAIDAGQRVTVLEVVGGRLVVEETASEGDAS